MDTNQELTDKLEREIWLFEQWLTSLAGQDGETQRRIRAAYEECINVRQQQLRELKSADRYTESA
jgi:hypothetical protein